MILTYGHDSVEVVDVDVDEHPVQPRQDLLALRLEGLGEGNVGGHREKSFVVNLSNRHNI